MSIINASYSSCLRKSLKKVINDIECEVPDTSANKMFISRLNAERRSIPYKAPEILNTVVYKIFDILMIYAPLDDDDDANNAQWKKNISNIWNDFGRSIIDKQSDIITDSCNHAAPS